MTLVRIIYWLAGLCVIAWCLAVVSPLFAHDANLYDAWCCNQNDCAPMKGDPIWLPDGRIQATTKHGTMIFDLETVIRPSRDGRNHACINPYITLSKGIKKGRCLYMRAGM